MLAVHVEARKDAVAENHWFMTWQNTAVTVLTGAIVPVIGTEILIVVGTNLAPLSV